MHNSFIIAGEDVTEQNSVSVKRRCPASVLEVDRLRDGQPKISGFCVLGAPILPPKHDLRFVRPALDTV